MAILHLIPHEIRSVYTPPLVSALRTNSAFLALIADYAEEVKLLLPAVLLSLWVKHPLPALASICIRGFYCGLSSAFLFAHSTLAFALCYFFLHTAVLLALAAAFHCFLPTLTGDRRSRYFYLYPLLFYSGVIFLLTVIRNLVYFLFL